MVFDKPASPDTSLGGPILIAGFGSIGQRHLRNLRALGHKKFVIFRTGKSTLPVDEISDIPVEFDLDKALAHKPIAAIITNPTALHMSVALAAARAGSHLFIEKPISHNLDGAEELQKIVDEKHLIVQVGFQFRFHPDLVKIKRQIAKNKIGKIVSVQAYWGEYLPDWHPWEDYKKSYSAREELGGGVLLTLCHPFDYLRFLFGEVESVSAMQSKSNILKIDVEDIADVLLRFKSGIIGNVHVDYIQRPAKHVLRIIGQNGIIQLDFLKSQSERNSMFVSEMKHFLSCLKTGKQPKCSFDDGIAALKVVLAAKESINKKRLITYD